MKNYYQILEVNETASQEIISKVFKIHIKKWHPDLYTGDDKLEAENRTKDLNEAYSILSDENKRAIYDMKLSLYNKDIETLIQENEMLKRNIERKDLIINKLILNSKFKYYDGEEDFFNYQNDIENPEYDPLKKDQNDNTNTFDIKYFFPKKMLYLLGALILIFLSLYLIELISSLFKQLGT